MNTLVQDLVAHSQTAQGEHKELMLQAAESIMLLQHKLGQQKRRYVSDVDLTFNELSNLSTKKGLLRGILAYLKKIWVGDTESRADDCRIGTAQIGFDKDNNLHVDFVTRFPFTQTQKEELFDALKQTRNLRISDTIKEESCKPSTAPV